MKRPTHPLARSASALLLGLALLLPAPTRAVAEEDTAERLPYRGTGFGLRNAVSALSFAPGAELTYNPLYALTFDFTAAWWLGDHVYASGALEAARELTEADDTTYRGEILLGDAVLELGAQNWWTIPGVGVDLSSAARLRLPTSKRAQAETLVLGAAANLTLSRTFGDVLGVFDAIQLAYAAQPAKSLHQYTTAAYQTPVIADCTGSVGGCERLLHSGVRNVSWSLEQNALFAVQFSHWLGAQLLLGTVTGFLYPLAEVEGVSYAVADPVDQRYINYYRLATTVKPTPAVDLVLGLSTINPQLRPDGGYRNPLLNRYTQLFVDVRLDAAGLISALRETRE